MNKGTVFSFNRKTRTGIIVNEDETHYLGFRHCDGRQVRRASKAGEEGPQFVPDSIIIMPKPGDRLVFLVEDTEDGYGCYVPVWTYEKLWLWRQQSEELQPKLNTPPLPAQKRQGNVQRQDDTTMEGKIFRIMSQSIHKGVVFGTAREIFKGTLKEVQRLYMAQKSMGLFKKTVRHARGYTEERHWLVLEKGAWVPCEMPEMPELCTNEAVAQMAG